MIKAKKSLIFLILLFLILITFFTNIRFRTVKHFTRIYTYPEWKLNEYNGFRLAFLEFLNKKSFLPFYIELYIYDSDGKKLLLDKGTQKSKLYNKKFKIEGLREGSGHIKGIIKFKNDIVDNFDLKVKIIKEYSYNKINFAPRVITEANTDFNEEDKVTIYPRFKSSHPPKDDKDIYIQLFAYPKDFAFSEKNKVFLLFTLSDYTPLNIKTEIDFSDFTSKRKKLTLLTDENGLISFDEYIYKMYGYIYLNSEYFGKKKLVYDVSDSKTSVLSDKDIYSEGEPIKLTIKSYKKIKELFFNATISKSWIENKIIKLENNKKEIVFYPPENYEGFIEFSVHKGYSYLKDSSYKKVYIGSKEKLKKELLNLNNDFINKVINNNTDNELFYKLVFSQLDKNNKDTLKVYDSYKTQQIKLDKTREKYQNIIWYSIFAVFTIIILIIFITSYKSIKEAKENIEFQYQKKGGMIYLYFFTALLITFMGLILWILKIV